jgi:hypothetical protein
MQVVTSSTTGDEKGGGKIPGWDKTKNVFRELTKALGHAPSRTDNVAAVVGKERFKEIQNTVDMDTNNANKYIAAACLGTKFMQLYEIANTMHMDCKYFQILFRHFRDDGNNEIYFSWKCNDKMIYMSFTDKLKDMTLPAHLSDRSVKGVVTGLQIGPGLTVSTFLFEMARTDCNLWCSIEVLTQLCNRSINVKEAKRLIRANRELQVIFFCPTGINLGF